MASLRDATASTSASVGGLASSGRLCRCVFVGLCVFVEAVWLWYLWSVVSVDGVVGGLVCGGWIGVEMCVNRWLVSSKSMSVLYVVGA